MSNEPKIRDVPRLPTDQEWYHLSKSFPQLQRDTVTIIGEKTKSYNCIGWSLGIDQWFNPFSPLPDFSLMYRLYNSAIASSDGAIIDGWGRDNGIRMEHASKLWSGTWSSKIGASVCITHNREGLASPRKYGTILVSYMSTQSLAKPPSPNFIDDFLSSQERDLLNQAATTIPKSVSQDFESAFQAWKNTWFEGNMGYSSNTYHRASNKAFDKLTAMGKQVIPLVIQKLADPDNFMAIVLYEQLEKSPNLQAQVDRTHLESEQTRSRRIVKLWLNQLF